MKARGITSKPPFPPACTDPALGRLLPVYDALEPERRGELGRHVAACPRCGPRWEVLTAGEAWLESAPHRNRERERSACPAAEDLYDYGTGPGHRSLPGERREEIERHVTACADCRELLATLDAPVPVPWIGGIAEGMRGEAGASATTAGRRRPAREPRPRVAPEPEEREEPARRRSVLRLLPKLEPETWRTWVPVAAAAAALLLLARVAFVPGGDPTVVAKDVEGVGSVPVDGFPEAPVLRGTGEAGTSPLLFPRDRVLAGADGAPVHAVLFELVPQDGAASYRVELRRHDGGAFDVGVEVGRLQGDAPALDASHLALEPGHYTWEAWAVVHGLERFLGERDFQVAFDEALHAEWDELADEPERGLRRLRLLHERGYVGDARALARTLPESEGRTRYLEGIPGR
jgi:anti-sigma factor RsiW